MKNNKQKQLKEINDFLRPYFKLSFNNNKQNLETLQNSVDIIQNCKKYLLKQ